MPLKRALVALVLGVVSCAMPFSAARSPRWRVEGSRAVAGDIRDAGAENIITSERAIAVHLRGPGDGPDYLQPISEIGEPSRPPVAVPREVLSTRANEMLPSLQRGDGPKAIVLEPDPCTLVRVDELGAPTAEPLVIDGARCILLSASENEIVLLDGLAVSRDNTLPAPLDILRLSPDGAEVHRVRVTADARQWIPAFVVPLEDGSILAGVSSLEEGSFWLLVSPQDGSFIRFPGPDLSWRTRLVGGHLLSAGFSVALLDRGGALRAVFTPPPRRQPSNADPRVVRVVSLADGNLLVVSEDHLTVLTSELAVVAGPIEMPSVRHVVALANGDIMIAERESDVSRRAFARVLSPRLELRGEDIQLGAVEPVGLVDTSSDGVPSVLLVANTEQGTRAVTLRYDAD